MALESICNAQYRLHAAQIRPVLALLLLPVPTSGHCKLQRESNDMITESTTNQLDSADVTSALNGILTTDKFSASPQMSAFLKYVVEQTLLGNTRRIKAFTVGIEALGKSSSFDPQTDPSVRVLAKRLRSSLDAYYEKNPDTTIFIEMKPGSYIPKFLLRSEMAAAQQEGIAPVAINEGTTLGAGNTAHVNVAQDNEAQPAQPVAETDEARAANMRQMWQAYRTTSKVA